MFQLLDTTSYNDFAVSLKKFRLVPALFESKNQNVNWLQLQFSSLLHLFRVHFFRASWVTKRPFTIQKAFCTQTWRKQVMQNCSKGKAPKESTRYPFSTTDDLYFRLTTIPVATAIYLSHQSSGF